MAKNYRYVSAVGQINQMACWAASLKWWYRAAMSINPSQQKLYDLYKHLATQQGGMTDAGIRHVISQNGMELLEYDDAAEFTWDRVKGLLEYGPIYTAYTDTSRERKRHVNVIYEIIGDGPWAEVRAMEPQYSPAGEGKYVGKHVKRSLSEYNTFEAVFAGVHRKKYWENNSY